MIKNLSSLMKECASLAYLYAAQYNDTLIPQATGDDVFHCKVQDETIQ
jgi:hypothetical protein